MRFVDTIVIHAAATPPSMDIGADEIRKWHTDPKPKGNGWSNIGYHYVIRRDGHIENGRLIDQVGAHVRGHNVKSIGICLIGGVREDNVKMAENNFTRAQFAGLRLLLATLRDKYPQARVLGHRDLDNSKACPCFSVRDWMAEEFPERWEAA